MYRAFILRYPKKQGFLDSYIWGPKTQFKFVHQSNHTLKPKPIAAGRPL